MKYALFLLAGLYLSTVAQAQNAKFDSGPNIAKVAVPDTLKVTLSKDNLFVVYKNQEIPDGNIRSLDSLLKKIPGSDHLTIKFESQNAEPEKIRSINTILQQCHCHITRQSVSFNKY